MQMIDNLCKQMLKDWQPLWECMEGYHACRSFGCARLAEDQQLQWELDKTWQGLQVFVMCCTNF